MKPILRWAGGKSRLIHHLRKFIPTEYGQYWEPFLGAGALFFALSPEKAILNDLNEDLINCYRFIKSNADLINRYLREHLANTSEEYYYYMRETYNRSGPSHAQAARFIYLNKTSFNGIFRVNLDGQYNVPYGHKEPPALPSLSELRAASAALNSASLNALDFYDLLMNNHPSSGDFVYLDPPYPPLSDTAYFRHYTQSRFSMSDHHKVAELANHLRSNNVDVMISNADIPEVRKLYSDWNLHTLPVVRWIAANGDRMEVSELVITSYESRHKGGDP